MIHINLLPNLEVEKASSRRKEVMVAGTIFVVAFAVISSIHVLQSKQMSTAQAKTALMEAQIKKIRKENKEVDGLIKKKELLKQKLTAVTSLTSPQRRSASVRILDDLSQSTPELLWLTDFAEINGAAKIQGEAVDNQTIATFARNLSNSFNFQKVEIRETVQEIQNSGTDKRGRNRRKGQNEQAVQIKRFLIEAALPAYTQTLTDKTAQEDTKRKS